MATKIPEASALNLECWLGASWMQLWSALLPSVTMPAVRTSLGGNLSTYSYLWTYDSPYNAANDSDMLLITAKNCETLWEAGTWTKGAAEVQRWTIEAMYLRQPAGQFSQSNYLTLRKRIYYVFCRLAARGQAEWQYYATLNGTSATSGDVTYYYSIPLPLEPLKISLPPTPETGKLQNILINIELTCLAGDARTTVYA